MLEDTDCWGEMGWGRIDVSDGKSCIHFETSTMATDASGLSGEAQQLFEAAFRLPGAQRAKLARCPCGRPYEPATEVLEMAPLRAI